MSVTVRVVRSAVIRPAALDLARARATTGGGAVFDAAGEPLSVRVVEERRPQANGVAGWIYVFPDAVSKPHLPAHRF